MSIKDVNRAAGKPSFQSSTLLKDDFYWNSSLAVDGNFHQYNASETRTCSSTAMNPTPWWYVDMEGLTRMEYILVYGQAGRFMDFVRRHIKCYKP